MRCAAGDAKTLRRLSRSSCPHEAASSSELNTHTGVTVQCRARGSVGTVLLTELPRHGHPSYLTVTRNLRLRGLVTQPAGTEIPPSHHSSPPHHPSQCHHAHLSCRGPGPRQCRSARQSPAKHLQRLFYSQCALGSLQRQAQLSRANHGKVGSVRHCYRGGTANLHVREAVFQEPDTPLHQTICIERLLPCWGLQLLGSLYGTGSVTYIKIR